MHAVLTAVCSYFAYCMYIIVCCTKNLLVVALVISWVPRLQVVYLEDCDMSANNSKLLAKLSVKSKKQNEWAFAFQKICNF